MSFQVKFQGMIFKIKRLRFIKSKMITLFLKQNQNKNNLNINKFVDL